MPRVTFLYLCSCCHARTRCATSWGMDVRRWRLQFSGCCCLNNEKDKGLVLPVPFACAIEDSKDDAEKAIRNLAVEMGSISVKAAWARCTNKPYILHGCLSAVLTFERRFEAAKCLDATRIACSGFAAHQVIGMTITIIVAVIITLFVLGAGAWLTKVGSWYRNLRKPWWNPPEWLFGPAWTVILGLAAWAGVLAWTSTSDPEAHSRIAVLFGINIFFHLLWTPLFFNLRRPDWALIEVAFLWLSVAALMIGLAPYSAKASLLLLPYLLWVAFAAYLNLVIVRMNAPFGSRALVAGE